MSQSSIACLNGAYIENAAAMVHISDRGFRFGDGVFESIRIVNAKPYQLALHLARMEAGLSALRITPPSVDWQSVTATLIARNNATTGFLRIAISRGQGSRGYLPDVHITPTWAVEYIAPTPLPEGPLTLWVSTTTRPPLSALPASHKLAQGVGSTLALLEAHASHCDEALLLTHNNHISEAASANIFWIANDTLHTPALSTACLAGTTRAAILRLAPATLQAASAPLDTLANAQAVFLTNARLGVWPVSRIQPNGWSYDTNHPLMLDLAERLIADYTA